MIKKADKEIKSTAHSKYRCQYHIVFAPKYRRDIEEAVPAKKTAALSGCPRL